MKQVLLEIPIGGGVPIYGFGMMLFLAFVVCTWLASRRARQLGIAPERIQDMAVWVFIAGIAGARLTYLITENRPLSEFYRIWDGGLVFYGSILGGALGYVLAYFLVLKKHAISNWQVADVVAPAIAIGICLGRFGCFLNGCCYGHVNCSNGPAVSFPLSSQPRYELVAKGYQTPAGFTMNTDVAEDRTVEAVEPASAAFLQGLRAGDVIIQADKREIRTYLDLRDYLAVDWPRGKTDLELTVRRDGEEIKLSSFEPKTLGLHPTQLYSSVGGFLILLVLLAYYPLRRRDGEVMGLLMLVYPLERFVEELLRSDNPPLTYGLTFSQHISLGLFLAGLVLAVWLRSRPAQYAAAPA